MRRWRFDEGSSRDGFAVMKDSSSETSQVGGPNKLIDCGRCRARLLLVWSQIEHEICASKEAGVDFICSVCNDVIGQAFRCRVCNTTVVLDLTVNNTPGRCFCGQVVPGARMGSKHKIPLA